MKKTALIIVITFFMLSCGKKEEVKFEAFSPEAFAYDIGDSWEVNSSVYVRGFEQNKDEASGTYSASIHYNVDMIKPDSEIVENIYEDNIEKNDSEKMIDVRLEAQFDLDSSYAPGKYQVIFNISDDYSGSAVSSTTDFELKE